MKVVHAQSLRQGYAHMLSTDVDFKVFLIIIVTTSATLTLCPAFYYSDLRICVMHIVYHTLHHNILIGHQDRLNF